MEIEIRSLKNIDKTLLLLAAAVLAAGFTNLYSATAAGAPPGELPAAFARQLAAAALGLAAFVGCLFFDRRYLEGVAPFAYAGALLLLLATLAFAPVTRGNQSWLVYGPFSIQPAEFAKLGFVLMLAREFARQPPDGTQRLRDLIRPALIAALPIAIIILQRDLGVALLSVLVAATYLFFVRIPKRAWFGMAGAALAGAAGLWFFGLKEYQRARILDFVDPARDPLASGYQAIQSRIAVGSGGFGGQGFLEGTQTQLQFLPTRHTDFVFSVLAEEWGFLGCTALLALYFGMLLRGLVIAMRAPDKFSALVAAGCVGMLFWPAAVNIAMVLGLSPVVGVPLPLLSYGGSQLLANMMALGLLANISVRKYSF